MHQKYPQPNQLKYTRKQYRVRNWPEYETGLRNRGDLTIWLSEDAIRAWHPLPAESPAGSATTQTRDLGNLLAETSPDRGVTTWTHDAAGNALTMSDARGIVTGYTWDALNRLTGVTYPDASLDVSFEYDEVTDSTGAAIYGKGRLTRMIDAAGETRYRYDGFGRLVAETRLVPTGVGTFADTFVTAYGYDAADRLTSITYPSGRVVSYERMDPLGRITAVRTTALGTTETLVENLTYLPFGPLSGFTYGNQMAVEHVYDLQYRLTAQKLRAPGGALVEHRAYVPDRAGNIEAIEDAAGVVEHAYAWDLLHRLDLAGGDYAAPFDGSVESLDYGYDGAGNRTSLSGAGMNETLLPRTGTSTPT